MEWVDKQLMNPFEFQFHGRGILLAPISSSCPWYRKGPGSSGVVNGLISGPFLVILQLKSVEQHLHFTSGKMRKLVAERHDTSTIVIQHLRVPGGAEAFELAAKFCYGINFEITSANVAQLCLSQISFKRQRTFRRTILAHELNNI
ncbi:BTB/POZ domain-containing protein [Drosera capensis]